MGENETASPDWAWAILDRVITTSSKGFAETHTLAIADSRDPREGDYLTPPAQLQQIRVHGFPRAGVDPVDVCYLATAQSTLHPDPDFRRECLARARERAATGDIDPEYMALIESASRS